MKSLECLNSKMETWFHCDLREKKGKIVLYQVCSVRQPIRYVLTLKSQVPLSIPVLSLWFDKDHHVLQ